MIKAVIFDCFGVLSVDGWLPYKERHFGKNTELFDKATEVNKRADAGLISYEDFLQEVTNLAGIQIENNPPNEKLFDYIRESLKPKYKIGLLSNAAADWLEELFTPEQRKLIDATALSFELGFIKPDPESYQAIAERLDVKLDECVFIDDQNRYCEGAQEVGMQAVCYQNFEQTKQDLEKILAEAWP